MAHNRDYGNRGRIGLLTPQANPTAEPEFSTLLPEGVTMLTARCTSAGEPRQRFLDYFRRIDRFLDGFDTLDLDAAGFACTASSYLLDEGEEEARVRELASERGYPLVTAAAAIRRALGELDAKTIALACPYPAWLFDRAVEYWNTSGYSVRSALSLQPGMGDTRAIYEVSGKDASQRVVQAFRHLKVDAIVITGTGMPGLQAVIELQAAAGIPVITSNLCLAWACLRAAGISPEEHRPSAAFPLLDGWQGKLSRL